MIREVARSAALYGLSALYEATGRMRDLQRPRVQLLYSHDLLAADERAFRELLIALMKDHSFVPFDEAVQRILDGRIDRPLLALSFDDGLKGCVVAMRIMAELGIRACFFVCPAIVDEADPQRLHAVRARLNRPSAQFMSWSDLERARRDGHEVGSHTMTHAELARVPAAQLRDEIHASAEILRQRLGEAKHFAWPFGRFTDFSERAAREVFAAGYVSCSSAERGCHVTRPRDARQLCLRRDHVIAGWPMSHVRYFLAHNSRHASGATNWPWPSAS